MNYNTLFDPDKFNELTKYFAKNLSNLGKKRRYKKDEFYIFTLGDKLVYFEEGEADVSYEEFVDKGQLLYKVKKGSIIGEIELLSDNKRNYGFYFIQDTTLRHISKNEITTFLQKNPLAYNYFIKSIVRAYDISLLYLLHNYMYSSEKKLLEFLLRIAFIQSKDSQFDVQISGYTHESIGKFINTSRSVVSKTLKNLEKKELIKTEVKKITILDIEKLKIYNKKVK